MIWLIEFVNISFKGLYELKILETTAAKIITPSPSILISTGKSVNNYLCNPIIHATKYPTAIPIIQELTTKIND